MGVPFEGEDEERGKDETAASSSNDNKNNSSGVKRARMACFADSVSDMRVLVPEKMIECGICLDLIVEPLTIACGHSFCRMCLHTCLRRSNKKCPACRAVCHAQPAIQPVSSMLASIARAAHPEKYAERERAAAVARAKWDAEIPLFFYNNPMVKGERLMLHLFEPRYKLMMQRIVGTTRRFGYLPCYTRYAAEEGAVGLYADLTECEFLADGRALLKATLSGRFRIKNSWVEEGTQNLSYATTESFSDDAVVSEEEKSEVATLVTQVLEKIDSIDGSIRVRMEDIVGMCPRDKPEDLSFWLLGLSDLDNQNKQRLLESTNTKERLKITAERMDDISTSRQCALQ